MEEKEKKPERDSKGRFKKGESGNPGGQRGVPEELKRYGREAPGRLRAIADDPKTPIKVKANIEQWFAEMTFGKPKQAVDLDMDSIPQVIFMDGNKIPD